jgi:hypothetical protein
MDKMNISDTINTKKTSNYRYTGITNKYTGNTENYNESVNDGDKRSNVNLNTATGTTIKIIDFGTRTKIKSLKSRYFDMPPEAYNDSPIAGGIRSLYYIGCAAQKQALQIVVPPTVILRLDHDNMFVYTKAATK